MTGAEHYAEAERILGYLMAPASASGSAETNHLIAAQAQVHATLALVAATVDAGAAYTATYTDRDGFKETAREFPHIEQWAGVLA